MNLTATLLAWYEMAARELPWRKTRDPYCIWISEVILQQTRVKQGYSYYERFIARFPDVGTLATAPEEEVLKLWQGLGYYSRARNLHTGARQIMQHFQGVIPLSYKELIKIKGIGPYTAAAIASIAGNEPVPVLDGNTLRVYSRLFGIQDPVDKASGREQCRLAGEGLMFHREPGNFNQAVMELGALICTPRSPRCQDCPVRMHCLAYARNLQDTLPRKAGSVSLKEININYLVLLTRSKDSYWLFMKQRKQGIWRHLYDFPENLPDTELQWPPLSDCIHHQLFLLGIPWNFKLFSKMRHVLTHRTIHAQFNVYIAENEPRADIPSDWMRARLMDNNLPELPIPRLIEKFLKGKDFMNILV
ncbi:MAG: A/G-specific adenine glycosylase [Bacteroidales bacterium]|jgi:A/G-specific adenine glycosylase|nr:A/G-specific adenine glycosylase [Bacteroidales bacterium]NPV35516.1 A/G-specific adenine glycosylase [Bacteroidales bacterium]